MKDYSSKIINESNRKCLRTKKLLTAHCSLLTVLLFSLFILLFSFFFCLACSSPVQNYENGFAAIKTYKDIPGITQEEINAIEALQKRGTPLIYASSRTTELFEQHDGTLGGYTVLFCSWLSELFGIPFQPEIQGLGAMLANLKSGDISFATLSDNPERRQYYFATNPIANRSVIMLRMEGSPSIDRIIRVRLPRYVFTQGSVMIDIAAEVLESGSYEAIIVQNEEAAYQLLKEGEADAFIVTNNMEAAFDHLGGIHTEDFLPLIFLPAIMVAEKPEYEAVISVVTKALNNGAYDHLSLLYRQGYQDYLKNKFFMSLTPEEKDFLKNTPVIPFVSQFMAYPVSFYNQHSNLWEGIVFDILAELEKITGFKFEMKNDHTTELPELLEMLERGDAFVMPDLISSTERARRFIWTEAAFMNDQFALISRRSYRNIELNDVMFERVGMARNTAFADMFRQWFPDAGRAVEYPTTNAAFAALEKGDVDLVISGQSRLLALTNYYEFSDYKANFLFNISYAMRFGLNKDQTVLSSILDKALPLIETDRITAQWMSATYNIEYMRLRSQRPWLVSAVAVSFFVLVLLLFFLVNNHIKRKTISKQAGELSALLEKTKQISEYELQLALTQKDRETDERTKVMLDFAPIGINFFDKDFTVIDCNKTVMDMFGIDSKEEYMANFYKYNPEYQPDGRLTNEAFTDVQSKVRTRNSLQFEWLHKKPNGDFFPCEVVFLASEYKGIPVTIAYMRDLTKEKEAEKLAQTILDTAPFGTNIWNKNFKITYTNKELVRLFGFSSKEEYSENFNKIFPEYQPDGQKSQEMAHAALKKAFDEGYNRFEIININKKGEKIPNEITLVRIRLNGDDALIAFSRDLREQKKMLTEIEKARNAAEAASIAKSTFLANMSHEIRTPMNSIIGFAELAADQDMPPKAKDYLGKILQSAELLLNIISDILDISKIESGKMELDRVPFDLPEIFGYCRNAILPKAEEKGLVLYCYAEPSVGKRLVGDPVRLRQVLLNILSNAVKFTNTGTVKLLASIKDSTDDSATIRFEVKDSGIGMSAEQIAKIFHPFTQADSSITRRYGGTGLGLTITKDIIEMMGGTLQVESAPEIGSKFSFEITFDTIDCPEDIKNAQREFSNAEKPKVYGEILVCEDNQMNQQVICEHLDRLGLKVVVAENGKEGVDIVKERIEKDAPFDLIFMDIHMPVMDGLEAAELLKNAGCKTPIITLTANVMSDELEGYKTLGMTDFLSKPFSTQDLWNLLAKYLPSNNILSDINTTANKNPIDGSEEDEDARLNKRLQKSFLRDNKTIYQEISKALDENDIVLAHRLAHTLKSNAAHIGEKTLVNLAASTENALKNGKNNLDSDLLKNLESELNAVIHRISQ